MEYKILEGCTIGELSTMVEIHVARGWRPQGGVAVCIRGSGYYYFQAMTK